jgi:hypothetical protein
MLEENIFINTSFQIVNDTAAISEISYVPIILELFNIILLLACTCLIYSGIEISHPVYAVLFYNLVIALLSSFINSMIFPFVKNINFTNLVNGNSVACLLFHCSSWCVLSLLRYMYIIHKSWIDETFPEPFKLLLLSVVGVIFLFSFGLFTIILTVTQFGWPAVKIANMPNVAKARCLLAIFGYYLLLMGISCCFYIMILRKRGKFGHNNVHILDQRPVEEIQISTITLQRTNAQLPDTDVQNGERMTETIQSQGETLPLSNNNSGLEQNRQLAEIQSAIRSLETNFVFSSFLIVTFLIGALYSNPISANIFICLKGLSPILTMIINFVKIQQLVQQFLDNLLLTLTNWKRKIMCK